MRDIVNRKIVSLATKLRHNVSKQKGQSFVSLKNQANIDEKVLALLSLLASTYLKLLSTEVFSVKRLLMSRRSYFEVS